MNGQTTNNQDLEKGTSIQRNTLFNLDEIKVRWKKAALENCPGVPCVVSPPAPSFTCGTSTITDIDNNIYNTVLIGTQCWTKENLKVTKYNDGTVIPDLTASTSTPWANSGARTDYVAAGVTGYVGTFGYLYNWYAVNDLRKLCPAGWHVPTDAEWTIMIQTLDPMQLVNSTNVSTFAGAQSTTAGGKMKQTGLTLWNSPNTNADNTSGFSALPGGYRDASGNFSTIGIFAVFWSATESASLGSAWFRYLASFDGNVTRTFTDESVGFSVRCLRD